MRIDDQKRIKRGSGWIRESEDWLLKYPLGPVRWDVWSGDKLLLATEVPADEITGFLVSQGMLVLW